MTYFLIKNASVQSFWSDEMSTIGYIRTGTSVFEVIKGYMVNDAVNLPLYPLLMYLFYRILPYGEMYLLLPSIILCIGAIIIISKIGYICVGEEVSLASVCFGAISIWLIYRGAWDIRCYTLLVFLSALTLYFYVKRLQEESYKNILLYGISMLFLFYTHWFGALQMIPFVLYDLYLFLQKKVRFRCIISYLISGGGLLPWMIIMLFITKRDLSGNNAMSDIPDLSNIKETLYYLVGERYICFLFLISGGLLIGLRHFWKCRKKQKIDFLFIVVWTFACLVGGVFVYCAYINPTGTFYENKYFMVSLPQVILIMSYSVYAIIKILLYNIDKLSIRVRRVVKMFLYIFLGIYYIKLLYQNYTICYNMAQDIRMPYRQCAEYLSAEKEIYKNDVLVVSSETTNLTKAWLDYYFVKRDVESPVKVVVTYTNRDKAGMEIWDSLDEEMIKDKYRRIIVFTMSFPRSETMQDYFGKTMFGSWKHMEVRLVNMRENRLWSNISVNTIVGIYYL